MGSALAFPCLQPLCGCRQFDVRSPNSTGLPKRRRLAPLVKPSRRAPRGGTVWGQRKDLATPRRLLPAPKAVAKTRGRRPTNAQGGGALLNRQLLLIIPDVGVKLLAMLDTRARIISPGEGGLLASASTGLLLGLWMLCSGCPLLCVSGLVFEAALGWRPSVRQFLPRFSP